MSEVFGQGRFRSRMVWASAGAAAAVRRGDVAVVVDVLSFTTALSIATDLGTDVYPYVFGEGSAADFARHLDAKLAVGRRQGLTRDDVSLSPASILAAPPLHRMVLPSPNGSAISFGLKDVGATVVGACLRNRGAVAAWVRGALDQDAGRSVTVMAAGERWSDGSLRPTVEDLWGAGAVLAALEGLVGGFQHRGTHRRSGLPRGGRVPGGRPARLRQRSGAGDRRVRRGRPAGGGAGRE